MDVVRTERRGGAHTRAGSCGPLAGTRGHDDVGANHYVVHSDDGTVTLNVRIQWEEPKQEATQLYFRHGGVQIVVQKQASIVPVKVKERATR